MENTIQISIQGDQRQVVDEQKKIQRISNKSIGIAVILALLVAGIYNQLAIYFLGLLLLLISVNFIWKTYSNIGDLDFKGEHAKLSFKEITNDLDRISE